MTMDTMTRRSFVANMAKAAFGAAIVPRHVLGGPGFLAPSDRVNVAIIGAGGMGAANASALAAGNQNIVALADVDFDHVDRTVAERLKNRDGSPNPAYAALQAQYAKARRYADFRRMLERERNQIDAVLIATPDHVHAVAAKRAMELGKHVYVQKPLTYSVHEARVLADTAKRTRVVTQMGNQGRSSDDARLVNEWIQAGVIGPVREVHIWTNRPVWPQGLPRPDKALGRPRDMRWNQQGLSAALAGGIGGTHTAPPKLAWDVFLGPARWVDYHPVYHPFNWRGWTDWGVGALGDMGAHLIDPPFWALELGYPDTIEATSTPWGGPPSDPATYPLAMAVHYEFPARGALPPVALHWYDGGLMPQRPAALPEDVPLNRGGGVIFEGEKGILMHGTYGQNPRLFPQSLMEVAQRVPQRYPRIPTSHEMNWIEAIQGRAQATSPFSEAAPLTEIMLLGLVALRTGQGARIRYDAPGMRVTSHPEANQYLRREYRPGWEL
ncbi:MAG: Gfo/Idh/MocA family oxidoreductase [Gemmatimonadota bacterium]|nr:Gfo/Idh/MocA family oxidoreductase [Gemmatimonadota bacterium]